MNLNVEVNDSCIDNAIETLMEGPLSDVKSESEEYTDACIEELKNELTEYVDDSVTDRDSTRLDDMTERLDDMTECLENLEATVKSLYMFKKRAALELLLVCKLRSVFREFMDHAPAKEVSNDELG